MDFINYSLYDKMDNLSESFFDEHKKDIDKKIKAGVKITASEMRKIADKLYAQSPEQMLSDIPSAQSFLRFTAVVGIPLAVNPFLGLFTFLADKAIKDSVDSRHLDKYINKYKKEIVKLETQIAKAKSDERKEVLTASLRDCEKGLDALESKKRTVDDAKSSHLKYSKDGEEELVEAINNYISECFYVPECNELTGILIGEGVIRSSMDKMKRTGREVKADEKSLSNKIDKKGDDMYDAVKKAVVGSPRDKLVTNARPSLSKLIKGAAATGVAYMINPALAAITLVTTYAIRKTNSEKERRKLLAELKQELDIVEEKIKDADSSGDRQKKYELMRLKNKLTVDIDRLRRFI